MELGETKRLAHNLQITTTTRDIILIVNKKVLFFLFASVLILGLIIVIAFSSPQKPDVADNPDNPSEIINETAKIIVYSPKPNDVVTSPLIVKGKAKGTWYFEGEFPITLYYGVKDSFVNINAFALGEWMTEDFVDFVVIIDFPVPQDNDGLLELKKNNPSDLEEQNESLLIPVRFHE